ncbi:MAG: hypothetical protein LBB80_10250 [Treponema sp.]|nr:hypothetical protein [Treponema sp.]
MARSKARGLTITLQERNVPQILQNEELPYEMVTDRGITGCMILMPSYNGYCLVHAILGPVWPRRGAWALGPGVVP